MFRPWIFFVPANMLASFFLVVGLGCGTQDDKGKADDLKKSSKPTDQEKGTKKDDDHPHKPGAHGGIIVEIGKDSYHAEAVFEKGGILRFFTLGKDESKLQEIDEDPLSAFVKAEGDKESVPFMLRPEPQKGDGPGKTTQFVAHLPREMWGKSLEVTIPNIRFGTDRFRVGFKSASAEHVAMPGGLEAAEERKLYLSPGGKYTQEDIKANGNQTASQKFKGIKAVHDLKPKPGDKICPITLTKANPQFSWIIAGKSYEFCCPPCVDEFVGMAKENPDDLKEPEYYRKKK